jgi:hypothetical protein
LVKRGFTVSFLLLFIFKRKTEINQDSKNVHKKNGREGDFLDIWDTKIIIGCNGNLEKNYL